MGKITPKLSVSGTASDWGAAVAISVSDELTCEAPASGVSKIDLTAAGTFTPIAAGSAGTTFLYVKNNNTSGSGSVQLEIAGGTDFGTLENGEFAWIPIDTAAGCRFTGVTSTVEVEYAFFSRTA